MSQIVRRLRRERELPVQTERAGDPMLAFHDELDRLFDEFFGGGPLGWMAARPWAAWPFRGGYAAAFHPAVDIDETDEDVVVSVELPGMEEEEIDVSVSGNSLTIRGEKKYESREEEPEHYRTERAWGSFQRTVALPSGVDADNARATYEKGVLRVSLPKVEAARAKKINVRKAA